jgi:ribosomal-protein-alanine N-acetyltransferase
MNNLGTQRIETERLVLRKFNLSDAQDMFDNWVNNSAVCKYLTWEPHGNIEVTKDVIKSWLTEYETGEAYNWVIELKGEQKAVGSVTVIAMSQKHQSCELGYCLGENYWDKGIMTEAVKTVISFLFEKVGLHRIQAQYDTQNMASGKVLEKSGMKLEGTLRHRRIRKDGSRADGNIVAILYDDWMIGKI